MPRRVAEENITTRNARRALPMRVKPYYRLVRRGALPVHLGYYRQADGRPGTWVARRYLGDGRYETAALGVADDDPRQPADGRTILDFNAAVAAAGAWAAAEVETARAEASGIAAPTVRKAVADYIAARKARDPHAGADAELRLAHHVLSAPIADALLTELSDDAFRQWRAGLRRGGRGKDRAEEPIAPATLARLLNDLRAALRAAVRTARLSADVLATITNGCARPAGATRAREAQVLADDEVRRIVDAAFAHDADFGALVLVLATTGARFDQIARATVADLQPAQRRLMVPLSRKGRGAKAKTHEPVPLPDDVVARLRPLIAGRKSREPLLMRWHHEQAAGDRAAGRLPAWVRTDRRAWKTSAEMARPWCAVITAAELPGDLVPYSLRHSSIVRGLRAGLPVRLVAAVHDTSVAMIERHYAAFIVDASEDLLRRASVSLAPPVAAPVAALADARAKRARGAKR